MVDVIVVDEDAFGVVEGGLFGVGEVLFTPSADPGDGLFFESARIPCQGNASCLLEVVASVLILLPGPDFTNSFAGHPGDSSGYGFKTARNRTWLLRSRS